MTVESRTLPVKDECGGGGGRAREPATTETLIIESSSKNTACVGGVGGAVEPINA